MKGGISYTRTNFNQPDRKFINGTKVNEDEIEVSLDSEVKYIEIFNIPDTEVRMVDIIMFFEEKKKFLV